MSPDRLRLPRRSAGPPRVSGDEPRKVEVMDQTIKSAPRKRG